MSEIKQCWAFHRDGERCEHPAGHPGDHAIQRTWTDAECATPGEFAPVPYVPTARIAEPVITKPEPCVACLHMHVGGDCKCGCYEHI